MLSVYKIIHLNACRPHSTVNKVRAFFPLTTRICICWSPSDLSPSLTFLDPQSRVCLSREQSQEDGDYINANYIRVSACLTAAAVGAGLVLKMKMPHDIIQL